MSVCLSVFKVMTDETMKERGNRTKGEQGHTYERHEEKNFASVFIGIGNILLRQSVIEQYCCNVQSYTKLSKRTFVLLRSNSLQYKTAKLTHMVQNANSHWNLIWIWKGASQRERVRDERDMAYDTGVDFLSSC